MSEKVLLVDDEPEFLNTLSERMTARGMEITTAGSAQEALSQVADGNFDAIVLDLMMPGMDGIEAMKAIKQKNPEVQVILLSGHATLEKGIEAMKLGAVDFLEKPADIDALTAKIKEAQAKKVVIVEKQIEEKIKNIINAKGW